MRPRQQGSSVVAAPSEQLALRKTGHELRPNTSLRSVYLPQAPPPWPGICGSGQHSVLKTSTYSFCDLPSDVLLVLLGRSDSSICLGANSVP